jgi:hypothetical protein
LLTSLAVWLRAPATGRGSLATFGLRRLLLLRVLLLPLPLPLPMRFGEGFSAHPPRVRIAEAIVTDAIQPLPRHTAAQDGCAMRIRCRAGLECRTFQPQWRAALGPAWDYPQVAGGFEWGAVVVVARIEPRPLLNEERKKQACSPPTHLSLSLSLSLSLAGSQACSGCACMLGVKA